MGTCQKAIAVFNSEDETASDRHFKLWKVEWNYHIPRMGWGRGRGGTGGDCFVSGIGGLRKLISSVVAPPKESSLAITGQSVVCNPTVSAKIG
jgi:hypothetical protein